jgi:hypothetical protein
VRLRIRVADTLLLWEITMLEVLRDALLDIFDHCAGQGMVLPWIVCSASPNGSTLVMRLIGGGADPDVLAEHYEPQGFVLPMTIMVLDQHNEAAKVVLEPSKRLRFDS